MPKSFFIFLKPVYVKNYKLPLTTKNLSMSVSALFQKSKIKRNVNYLK